MGFPWGKKDDKTKESGDAGSKSGFSVQKDAAPSAGAPEATTATSVFEFGPVVSAGQDFMRGVCIGDDPDAIQACTWSVETAQRSREKHHLYRIEF